MEKIFLKRAQYSMNYADFGNALHITYAKKVVLQVKNWFLRKEGKAKNFPSHSTLKNVLIEQIYKWVILKQDWKDFQS